MGAGPVVWLSFPIEATRAKMSTREVVSIMQLFRRRATVVWILLTFLGMLAAGPVLARPRLPTGGFRPPGSIFRPPTTNSNTPTIQGTITALSAATANPQTFQVTDRNGLSITLKINTNPATLITRDGAAANFARRASRPAGSGSIRERIA